MPYGYNIVVVDDGSAENIEEEISDLPVWFARHRINLGQGAALQTGTDLALRQGAQFLIHFDSDGQHSAADISSLLRPLEKGEADIVIGSRFLNEEDKQAVPGKRRLLLRVARVVNGVLTGIWLTDAHNGFRALTEKAAKAIRIRENRMAHASEILLHIRRKRLRYKECPTHIIYTEYSQAKGQSAFNSINIVIDIIINRLLK